jgi:hypothetical protein
LRKPQKQLILSILTIFRGQGADFGDFGGFLFFAEIGYRAVPPQNLGISAFPRKKCSNHGGFPEKKPPKNGENARIAS